MTYETETDVRRVASEWHAGQWSALYAFSSTGTIRFDLDSEIEACQRNFEADPMRYADSEQEAESMRQELAELLAYITQPIIGVWSSHGHTFLHEGQYGSCLTCGGEWELVRDDPSDPSHGAYQAPNGDEATHCQGVGTEHGESRGEDDPGTCNCCLCHA